MIPARGRALLILAIAMAVAILIVVKFNRREPLPLPARSAAERPTLLLLTSLPLVFGEGFSVQQTGSPALNALERRYSVVPISVTDVSELAKGRLVLMAQPLAQPAEDLVSLDQWVRQGGRLLLLADPMLEWPSERPLGDPLRPPPMFMDTGLLGHWGLRLDRPERRGERLEKLGGFEVATLSPGELFGSCKISKDRLVADCPIGKGRAVIVADADFLDVSGLGAGSGHNLDGLLAELASLEHP
jgi:hypothetical protein